jgi:hypothetical protein
MKYLQEACGSCKDDDFPIAILFILKFKDNEKFIIGCNVSDELKCPSIFRDLASYLEEFKGIQYGKREDLLNNLQISRKVPFDYRENQNVQEFHLHRFESAKEEIEEFCKKKNENGVDYFLILLENPYELKEDIGETTYEYVSIYEDTSSENTLPICKSLLEIFKKKQ